MSEKRRMRQKEIDNDQTEPAHRWERGFRSMYKPVFIRSWDLFYTLAKNDHSEIMRKEKNAGSHDI